MKEIPKVGTCVRDHFGYYLVLSVSKRRIKVWRINPEHDSMEITYFVNTWRPFWYESVQRLSKDKFYARANDILNKIFGKGSIDLSAGSCSWGRPSPRRRKNI